jgi:hypothetical protein
LFNAQGALVADGFYNVEFKIYQDGSGTTVGNPGGTLLWTESHLNANSQGVQVKNGFLSVQLGSVTPFGTSVDWNQDTLWLSMNIGNTNVSCTPFSSCSPDGEMVPMKRLSSNPYALNSSRLGGLSSADYLQLAQGVQAEASNVTSIQLNKTGLGDFVTLQSGGTDVFTLTDSGDVTFGANADHTISVADAGADTVGNDLTIVAGNAGTGTAVDGGDLIVQGGASSGTGVSGSVIVQSNGSNSTTAFQVQDSTGDSAFNVDTTGNLVTIGNASNAGTFALHDGSGETVTFTISAQTSSLALNVPDAGSSSDIVCLELLANCGSASVSLQGVYNNSTPAQIVLDSTRGGLTLRDNSTPISANLFEVQSNGGGTTYFSVDANGIVTSGDVTIGGSITSSSSIAISTDGVTRATFDTANSLYLGNGVTAATPNDFTISGTGSTTTGVAGGGITIQGGNATVGDANGGNITLAGGAGAGTGVKGLVVIETPTIYTSVTQNCATNCNVTQANVDGSGAVLINTTGEGLIASLPDPTLATAGRIMYVTNIGATNDFTLSVNGGGTGNLIAMKPNTTATMIWNGDDWTAAGASSSTDLQSAYNNTLTSAGGAELVLNSPGGSADGLTIRNNPIDQVKGGILEVQTSIGTNLFSVNDVSDELAANGGAETQGASSSTFPANTWGASGSTTISRTTTSGEYITGQAGVAAATTAINGGAVNNLTDDPELSTTYQVSFAVKASVAIADNLEVIYTPDGGTTNIECTPASYSTQSVSTTEWTKVTCTIATTSAPVTDPDLIIRQTDAPSRTIWIDNLSFVHNNSTTDPSQVQIGGGITGGQVTLFTLDRSSAPPVADGNQTYLGSMYYDTLTGRIQCYESDGWGACGSAPDEIVTLTPEYTGAVLNGSGVGTMTADFCSNEDSVLEVNTSFCASGISRNYYRWTSPQASEQTYSIYVSYKLPNTFREFIDSDTIKLTWLTDSADGTNGQVTYQVYRSSGSSVTSCDGSNESTEDTPSANTWYTTDFEGDETACGFATGDSVIFKINAKAQSNANVYIENLSFTYLNQ